ncbi:MAG: hypothetical protein WA441_00360, partial [Methyloceanibacter sp.]
RHPRVMQNTPTFERNKLEQRIKPIQIVSRQRTKDHVPGAFGIHAVPPLSRRSEERSNPLKVRLENRRNHFDGQAAFFCTSVSPAGGADHSISKLQLHQWPGCHWTGPMD